MTDADGKKEESQNDQSPNPRSQRSRRSKNKRERRGTPLLDSRSSGGRRHQARILALQVLYEVDVTDHPLADVLSRTIDDPDEVVTTSVRSHVNRLVRGAIDHQVEIDKYIADAASAFPVNQLPAVDRNVLRLAIYELLSEPDVPQKAAINEAVELAKRFGGMNSSRFVNGVLGTVTDRLNNEQPNSSDSASESATS
jgi:N utilization substance protein B